MNIFELFLGIITSFGGFVDVSELVFASSSGSKFLYSLLWVLLIGTIGIIVFSEMSGRVAIATKKAVFDTVRERLPYKLGLFNLAFANIVNIITCAAEIGGIAIILRLLTGLPYSTMVALAFLIVFGIIYFLPFKWIERSLGILGTMMIVFIVTSISIHPPWKNVLHGLVPHVFPNAPLSLFFYFAVGILSSTMMPYEIYFYSSGAIEDKWSEKDSVMNKITSIVGLSLGSLLAAALIINSAVLFSNRGIDPHLLGTTALQTIFPFGEKTFIITLFAMLFAILGAAAETCLSAAYTICQFFKIPWGKEKPKSETKKFTYIWMATLAISVLLLSSGVDPLNLVEYAVVFSVVILPLSYYSLFVAANDENEMGKFVNGKLARFLGWAILIIISITSIAAIPLMILSRAGNI